MQHILIGLLRLRKCSSLSFRPELKPKFTPTTTPAPAPTTAKTSSDSGAGASASASAGAGGDGDGDGDGESNSGSVSIVRELHVYGSVVPIHSRDPSKFQHQG